jgi:hypothetical protein
MSLSKKDNLELILGRVGTILQRFSLHSLINRHIGAKLKRKMQKRHYITRAAEYDSCRKRKQLIVSNKRRAVPLPSCIPLYKSVSIYYVTLRTLDINDKNLSPDGPQTKTRNLLLPPPSPIYYFLLSQSCAFSTNNSSIHITIP